MKAVIYTLQNTAAITSLLSDGANSVFAMNAEQGEAIPYIVVDEVDTETNPTHSGTSTLDDVQTRVFIVSDRLYTEGGVAGAYEIGALVRTNLDNISGTINTEVIAGTDMESESTFYEGVNNNRVVREQIYMVSKRRL